jgi:hypothetical protein
MVRVCGRPPDLAGARRRSIAWQPRREEPGMATRLFSAGDDGPGDMPSPGRPRQEHVLLLIAYPQDGTKNDGLALPVNALTRHFLGNAALRCAGGADDRGRSLNRLDRSYDRRASRAPTPSLTPASAPGKAGVRIAAAGARADRPWQASRWHGRRCPLSVPRRAQVMSDLRWRLEPREAGPRESRGGSDAWLASRFGSGSLWRACGLRAFPTR